MSPKTVTLLLLLDLLVSFVAGLSTSGNKIVDSNGKPVLLRGVCRPSFEWNVNGESASLADYRMMASWGANVVRLPLNQDFWLSGASTYNPNYVNNIDQQVAWIKQAGMYCILDLHWSDQGNLGNSGGQQVMADANSVSFWNQVATRYANDPSILFELYNEPHDVSWSVWQKGGSSGGFQVYGMQQLYNAIRSRANNTVIVGGLNWAFDLSGVANYPITGTNIVYATHPYDYSGKQAGDWDAAFGYLTATYPVIMTEFGQYCATNTYVSDLLKYAAAKGIHWTAWAWYVNGCSFPSIINDWNGTPSSVGATVKSFLQSSGTPSTSSSGSSTTGVPQSSSTQVIYDDQLQNGWQDWSWATVSKTSTTPVYAGSYSFSFAVTNYGALYLHTPTPFYIGSYSSLQFYVNGGSSNPTQIIVKVYDTSSTPAPIGNVVSLPSSVQANKWVLETIPFSAFGLATTTQISGFVVQYNQADNAGTIYLDNISLVSSSTSTTTTKSSTSTASGATSTASGATSTASGATSTASGATSTASGATSTASGATSGASGATSTASGATGGAAASTSSAAASTSSAAASTSSVSASTASVAASTSASATTARSSTSGSSTGSAATGCSVSSVSFTQTLVNQWPSNGATIMQFSTSISHTCSSKQLVGLTLQPSNWNPVNYWNLQASGSQLVLPPSTSISSSSPYTSFGYQNPGTATFTIVAATFQ